MKARKTMKYQAVVQETVMMVTPHFIPDVSDVKKQIDTLIDKEYLTRVSDDNGKTTDSLQYVA